MGCVLTRVRRLRVLLFFQGTRVQCWDRFDRSDIESERKRALGLTAVARPGRCRRV